MSSLRGVLVEVDAFVDLEITAGAPFKSIEKLSLDLSNPFGKLSDALLK